MSAKKVFIAKDWWKDGASRPSKRTRLLHTFEQVKITRSEDLPELLTIKEAALLLKKHPQTIREWIQTKKLGSIKVMGRRFTTPEFIGAFLEGEMLANG